MKANRLQNEKSDYLKQHASNPVDWYPWGDEAIEKARAENKPILLSIGYSACHWCHVMAHESFEDPETATLMNQLFINIKVDREERPDLDKIYQSAHQILTQQGGGWPLTIFLTPNDLTPFLSGTYFPKSSRYHLPAFKDVLTSIADIYQNRYEDIVKQNESLHAILKYQPISNASEQKLTDEPIITGLAELEKEFDHDNGGFGRAPKFPQATKLLFLLENKPDLALFTLQKISDGGIFDQLAGGFFRYSVDEHWMIPHFEKMLYDNGQLTYLIAEAFLESANQQLAENILQTAERIIRHMQSETGGFYSSVDADSEGKEGKYYVWDKEEVKQLLTDEEYKLFAQKYGLNLPPNFENHWHLYNADPNIDNDLPEIVLAKEKLLLQREKRIPPHLDTKILTSWNALMIKGMFKIADVFDQTECLKSAEKALDFLRNHMFLEGKLFACHAAEETYQPGFLDDYAFTIDALLTGLELRWKTDDLHLAIALADAMLTYFADEDAGGFYFTPSSDPSILYRPKTMIDEAIPPGYGIAVQVLLKLGHLLAEKKYLEAAEKSLFAAWTSISNFPSAHCTLLMGLSRYLEPETTIIIRGKKSELAEWRQACKLRNISVFVIPNEETNLPGFLENYAPQSQTMAYLCKGTECSAVINNIEDLIVALNNLN